jgi:hypothetical protein
LVIPPPDISFERSAGGLVKRLLPLGTVDPEAVTSTKLPLSAFEFR